MKIAKDNSTTVITFESKYETNVLADIINDAREYRLIRKQDENILSEHIIQQLRSIFDHGVKIAIVNQYISPEKKRRSDQLKFCANILHNYGFPEFRLNDGAGHRCSIVVTAANYLKWLSSREQLFSFLLYRRGVAFGRLQYQLSVSQTPALGVINNRSEIANKFVVSAARYGFEYVSYGPKALSKLSVMLSSDTAAYQAQIVKYIYALMDVFWEDWNLPKPSEEQMATIIRTNFGIEPIFGKNG